jgi:hypothetical protein
MRPVSSAESIVDIHVEGGSQFLRKALVILLFLGIEAHVLQNAALQDHDHRDTLVRYLNVSLEAES